MNTFIKTPFQGFHVHQILIGCLFTARNIYGKFLVTATLIDCSIFLPNAHGFANINILVEVI